MAAVDGVTYTPLEEWSQVPVVLKRLSSRSFSSNEDFWRQQLSQVCSAVIQSEELLMRVDISEEDEKFVSQLIGLTSNLICSFGEGMSKDEEVLKQICKVIIQYCLLHLEKGSTHLMLSQAQLFSVLESMCKFEPILTKDDMLPFQCEELAVPQFLSAQKISSVSSASLLEDVFKSYGDGYDGSSKFLSQSLLADPLKGKSELHNELKNHNVIFARKQNVSNVLLNNVMMMKNLKEMASRYELISCITETPLKVEPESISSLSGELRLVKELLDWSIIEPLIPSRVQLLAHITEMGLKAALFVASGHYIVEKSEVTMLNGSVLPSESFCRKHGWKTTEYALAILETVCKMISTSTHLSGSVLVNLQSICVITILEGLKKILTTENVYDRNVNAHPWKWFEGINIMLVTVTSRVILMLSSLLEEAHFEKDILNEDKKFGKSIDLFGESSAPFRLYVFLSSLHLPSLLLDLFIAAYEKGEKLSKLRQQLEEAEKSAEATKDGSDKKSDNSSEEESSTEEGSMLGNFYVQTVADSGKTEAEDEEKAKEKQKDDVFAQSSEIFFLLASSLLDYTSKLFTICMSNGYNDEIRMTFTQRRLTVFANVLVSDKDDREDIGMHLTSMLCNVINQKVLDESCMDMLLNAFQISPSTTRWPLKLDRYILPIFARIVLIDIVEETTMKKLAYSAWRLFLASLVTAVSEENNDYTSAEYMQLMILFFQLLRDDEKKEIFIESSTYIIFMLDRKIISPIHLSRLLLIFTYMIHHCFDRYTLELPKQVQVNVLNLDGLKERPIFFPSIYSEDDIIKKFGKQLSLEPLFYMVHNLEKQKTDPKVIEYLQNHAELEYTTWYSAFVALMSKLVSQLSSNEAKDFYNYLGIRHSFLTMWSLLKTLPVPAQSLIRMKSLTEVSLKQEDYLFYLHWMPLLFELSLDEIKSQFNISFSCNDAKDSECKDLGNALLSFTGRHSNVILFGKKLMLVITNLFTSEKSISFTPFIVADGLVMFLWLLLKKYIIECDLSLDGCGENLNDLLLGLIYLLKIAVEKSKEMLVRLCSSKDLTEDKLHFYMDILGADLAKPTSEFSTKLEKSNGIHMKVLPDEFKEAMVKWNQIEVQQSVQLIPALFQSIALKKGEKNARISQVFGSCVNDVVKTHVDINNDEALQMVAGASLKRFIRTLTDLCVELLPWMHTSHKDLFEQLKAIGMSTFSGFSIDYVAAHISVQVETLTLLCLDDPGQDRVQIVGFIRMLEIIDKWMSKEFINGSVVEEKILICWLDFMSSLMDYSKPLVIFLQYFKQHTEILFQILKSLTSSIYSEKYIMENISFISKLLHHGDKIADSTIPSALLRIFGEDEVFLMQWIEKLIFSQDTEVEGCTLLRMLINLAIQNEYSMENCLSTILKVCSSACNRILTKDSLPLPAKFVFSNFFDVVINVATTNGSAGHIKLLQNTITWLHKYLTSWPTHTSSDKKTSFAFQESCNSLINYIAKMVSTLSSNQCEQQGSYGEDSTQNTADQVELMEPKTPTNNDESAGEDSEDESVKGMACTFAVTQRGFINQHWYHCYTCKMSDCVGCCTVCAKVCHKGHDVSYSKHGSFFCDCGAKEDNSCKAMRPSSSNGAVKSSKAYSPFQPWGEKTRRGGKRGEMSASFADVQKLSGILQGEDLFLLKQIMKDSKDELLKLLEDSNILETILAMLQKANVDFTMEVEWAKEQMKNEKLLVKDKLSQLYTKDKRSLVVDNLMISSWSSQEGIFENVKLNYSGDQGQTMRQLMGAHSIHYKPMCLITSANRQQFAVAHDKGKVTIVQLSGLLKQPVDGVLKKTSVNRLLSTLMPFTVLHMASNPINADFLAVTGLKDCHVLIMDQTGTVPGRLALSPKLETGNFIIKVIWLPNCQTKLAMLTSGFVKIYDLSKSEISCVHHFVPPNGKMRDVTFLESESQMYIIAMSSQGYIYTEVLNEASSCEPFYMMNVLSVEHPSVEETAQGQLNDGGTSIYYSSAMKLLFFSYTKGRSFIGALDKNITTFSKIFYINTPLTTTAPLIQWNEVAGQLGMVYCYQQNTGNIAMLNIKAEEIHVQEIKSPGKSKVYCAICYHHSSFESSSGAFSDSTNLYVLLEDGSLQEYKANEISDFLIKDKPVFSSSSSIGIFSEKKEKRLSKSSKKKSHSSTKFPIDFFEQCQVTNDVEYGGGDILHVYNSSQVANRLKIAGLYIANTKASGFKIEVTNKDRSNVIVGLRVHVGVQSMERAPEYVEVLGRITQMKAAKNRWFDVALTREESLTIHDKNKMVITFGPSSDPYGLSIVDSIKIYVKSKEAFGFPQNTAEATTPTATEDTHSSSADVVEVRRPCSYSEVLLASLLSTVNKCFGELPIQGNATTANSLLLLSSKLLTIDGQYFGDSSIIGYQAHALLHNLFPDDDKFYSRKDEIQCSHLVKVFKKSKAEADEGDGLIDIGIFEMVLHVAISIGNARPENLVRFIERDYNVLAFSHDIMKLFWKLHASAPSHSTDQSDSSYLSNLVEMIVEILFALMLGDKEKINEITNLIINLLLMKDLMVSFAAKQGLVKALQSRRKVTADEEKIDKSKSNAPVVPSAAKETKVGTKAAKPQPSLSTNESSRNVLIESQDVVVEIEETMDDDDDGIVMDESEMMSNGDIQLLLDDDSSVMEIALALSLQNHSENMDEQEIPLINDEQDAEGEDEEEEEEEEEEEFEDVLIPYQDEPQEQIQDVEEPDVDDCESDLGQQSFSESSAFVGTSAILSSDKTDTKTDTAFSLVWSQILKLFKGKLPELLELSGFQVIPFFQVLLILCSNLGKSEEDKEVLRSVVVACAQPLEIQKEEDFNVGERSQGSEVQLVLMRFLSVLMSRSNASKQSKENSDTLANSFDVLTAEILSEFGLIDHCLFLLKSLHKYWQKMKSAEDANTARSETTHLLKMKPLYSIPDMMPFFMEQYVQSHALDLFEAFPQLVTEMVLRVPYQIHKLIDASTATKDFSKDWTYVLCEYMLTPHTPLVRRQVRKLLLALCGSKEKYRFVKDLHNLRSHLTHVRELLHRAGVILDDVPTRSIFISYEDTVSLMENISSCIDIASTRIDNWQSFCKKEKAILPFLLQASYQVTDHISSKIIELINSALTSVFKKRDKQEKKEKSTYLCAELVKHVFSRCFGPVMVSFMKHFLLESNSSQLRWKSHSLIHTIYLNIAPEQQASLVELMWTLWDIVPNYGHRASQFVDLLGYFTLNTSHVPFHEKIPEYVGNLIAMLKEGNQSLLKHPNAGLYRKLQNFVELEGFYVESDPCVICNNPEITHTNSKLSSLKSDIRYTTTSQILKLSASHTIYKINLKISDVKRAKTVKAINLSYNNKPVPSAVELKNKPEIWQKAKKITLSQGQTDVKVELTFPITACNLMIEFAEFYDNAQYSSETLQCPRCSANVPAHPGVCSNCGENVFQCHKCRAINYDERDPFLCTSCGFCKYAKFEFVLSSHPCCSVESINSEEDREKALKSINVSLEKADQYYKQLSSHRQALEKLLNSAGSGEGQETGKPPGNVAWNFSALATASTNQSSSPAVAMSSINHSIQALAQRYCIDCKTAFDEMSKVTQIVTATRRELRQYDIRQQETLSQAIHTSPDIVQFKAGVQRQLSVTSAPSFDLTSEKDSNITLTSPINKCYGCALSAVYHCLTLLRAFSTINKTHWLMLDQDLLQELVEHNLQQRNTNIINLAKTLLIKLARNERDANQQLNRIICNRINLCLTSRAANMVLEVSLKNELSVMKESIASGDYLWEERFRCIFKLFMESLQHASPEVVEAITLPCLHIINSCMKKVFPGNQKVIPMNKSKPKTFPTNALEWLNDSANASLGVWKFSVKNVGGCRKTYLLKKYGVRWIEKVKKNRSVEWSYSFSINGWLRMLLFNPSSSETRRTICIILENLAKYPAKKQMLLHLLTSYMDELHSSGENAAEYLNLFKDLLNTSVSKVFMCRFGILDKICCLLKDEVDHLSSQESTTSGFDLAQGYALHSLAELLKSFLDDADVKVMYRGRFVAEVLQSYLALRKLVVQRTKLVDETQEILLSLLRQLTSGTEESAFMKTCIDTLKKCPVNDIRTPVFIFEQLCSVIHKEEEERSEFFMLLEKDPQQEDYLQGRMQGNPYSSKEPGLSPLMRDVKNKICTECELVALLEDDTGMELLVNNKIISLDLPVDEVYRKIWCNGKGESKDHMKIIYRMRGLLGDATEDMVENLDSNKDENVDEEHEYQRAGILVDIGGLEVILKRLSYIRDLSRAQPLVSVILKLLEYCVKVKAVRQYLNEPTVNAMKIMLATLNIALKLERDYGSTSGGAGIAERVLKIMEIILHEATAEADVKQVALPGEESQLELLLNLITSPYVKSNANVLQAMMRLTSFLTFGSEENMNTLIDHFMPFFDFDSFDKDKSSEVELHLDCFCMIAGGISTSASGSRLKDLIIKKNVISKAMTYLHSHTPPKSFRASGILDSAKWKDFLAKPSLPYILRMLTGLINGHSGTQEIMSLDENVELLHNLEQVSSEEMVGSLAENLMEALRECPVGKKKVTEVRRQTRNEKKMLAMAMRQKQLDSLGMKITSTGHIKAKSLDAVKEIGELQEETDQRLVCCICREGYKFYPTKVLGIYTYTSRCVLDEFENKPKRTQGYSTVSHFNVIHFDCHTEAVRHARSRDEWESAALQNGNTKCNGLLPMWGAQITESAFATCLARHNSYLQECTGFREPTFHSSVHDIRLMLLRFANQSSFSKETGGGGKHSNIFFLPYMIHVAAYVLISSTRQNLGEEQSMMDHELIKPFCDAPVDTWITSCYEVNGPYFASVLNLFVSSLDKWKSHRIYFLKRLMLLAHVRKVSVVPMNTLLSGDPKEYSVYKPSLMFFSLVNQLHLLCKGKLTSNDHWLQEMSTYLRNNDDVILKDADKILKRFEEDVLPCESFAEFCDVEGLLEEIPDAIQFINDILAPYCSDGNEVFC